MKKIMFAAVAALAIMSCSQNEEFDAPSQKAEISFGSIVGNGTRATPMINDNFANFKVYAYNTGDKTIGAEDLTLPTSAFMSGIEVTKKSENVWAFDGTYYWPLTDNLQFFAYSPAASENVSAYATTAKYPSFTYAVAATSAVQEDLLAAVAINKKKDDSQAGVTLTFQHLLTQINFSAKGETSGYKYNVTKISIDKVCSTSTFTYNGTDPVGIWGAASGVINTPYEYVGAFTEITGGSASATSFSEVDNALILMPQTLPADAIISVTYSVKDTTGAKIFEGTSTVSLADDVWTAGKSLRYVLTLKDNGVNVSFTPGVGEWLSEEADAPTTPESNK